MYSNVGIVSSSIVVPNGPCNDGLKRAPIFSSGITLIASKTSKNIRALFSILPPSVL
jgi:hypothetical protein